MTGQSIWASGKKNAIKIVDERTKLSYRFSAGSGCQQSGSISEGNHYLRELGSDRTESFSHQSGCCVRNRYSGQLHWRQELKWATKKKLTCPVIRPSKAHIPCPSLRSFPFRFCSSSKDSQSYKKSK